VRACALHDEGKKKRLSMANRNLVPEAEDSLDVYARILLALRSAPFLGDLKEGRQGFRTYLPLATAVGHSQVALFFTLNVT